MTGITDPTEAQAIDLARECLYRFLAAALRDPLADGWGLLQEDGARHVARGAAELLRGEYGDAPGPLGFGELPAGQLGLDPLLDELQQPREFLVQEYERVFGLVHARECPPYETEYHTSSDASFRAQQLADVAGFYRAFGLETARSAPERPDHVALELEFMALLLTKKRVAADAEDATVCDEAVRAFFRDHLAWWLPSFAAGLRRKAGDGLYAAVAEALAAFLPAERARLNVHAPRVPLQPVPIERPEEQPDCLDCAAGR